MPASALFVTSVSYLANFTGHCCSIDIDTEQGSVYIRHTTMLNEYGGAPMQGASQTPPRFDAARGTQQKVLPTRLLYRAARTCVTSAGALFRLEPETEK